MASGGGGPEGLGGSLSVVALAVEGGTGRRGPREGLVGVGDHGPTPAVGDAMVVTAGEGQQGEVGVAVVSVPLVDVVGVAPLDGPVAAREDAATVAHGEGDALSRGGDALATSEVERYAGLVSPLLPVAVHRPSPQGPDALFESADIDRLVQVLSDVRHNAEVA